MNEIADFRHAYKHNEISIVACIRSEQNIADYSTRREGNTILAETMQTGRLNFIIEQWFYKDDDKKHQTQKEEEKKQMNVIAISCTVTVVLLTVAL